MLLTICKGKLHRVKVTEANLDYRGSITIGKELMEAAGIMPFELVHVNSMSSAVHWETYVIPGSSGQICLNGCPARLFAVGDEVIILSLCQVAPAEVRSMIHTAVFVNSENSIKETASYNIEDGGLA